MSTATPDTAPRRPHDPVHAADAPRVDAGAGSGIEVDGLTRRYGDRIAVDAVSFAVPGGLMTGFVGGNGAGKTTTMRMIMGVLASHGGEVRWAGRPITAADRRGIGYMPEERGLYPKQRVADQLVYLARLKGMTSGGARSAVMDHLDRLGLADRADESVESLSLGNQQRVQIIAAVVTQPSALILDEPFSGLDPDAVDAMADLLREHTARGVPVLFSSHQLDLVDRLCDRLVVLAAGRVRAEGTSAQLRAAGPVRHRLRLVADAGWVRDLTGVTVLDVDGPTALLDLGDDPSARQGSLDRLLAEGLRRGGVVELAPVTPSLADIYREVTR